MPKDKQTKQEALEKLMKETVDFLKSKYGKH